MERRQYLSGLAAASGLAITGVSTASAAETLASWDDPEGDDAGPGNYTYPTTDEIPEGEFDLASFSVGSDGDRYTFTFGFHNELSDPWGGTWGFSHHLPQVYFHNPDGSGGSTDTRDGVKVTLEAEHHHRLFVTPFEGDDFTGALQDANGEAVSEDVSVSMPDASTIQLSIPQSAIGYLENAHVAPLVTAYDGYQSGGVRLVNAEAGEYEFGGAENDNAPQVIDLIAPEGTSQSDVLSYSGDAMATVPYLSISGDPLDGGSDNGTSDDGSSDDGSSDDGSSDDGGSETEDGGSDGESDGGDSGLPGFGIGVGLAGAAGGALAARRRGDAENDEE